MHVKLLPSMVMLPAVHGYHGNFMIYQWLHSYPRILWSQCIRISDFLLYRKMHMDTDRLLNNEGVR